MACRLDSSLLLLCLSIVVSASGATTTKVKLDVYYESLCPDSIKFITTQLAPTWKSPLNAFLDLNLIPYGKSEKNETDGKYTFTCHHGQRECEGNKVHACALVHLSSLDNKVKFINCTMTDNKPKETDVVEYRIKSCADSLELSLTDIQTCASGKEGETLLARQGDLTNKFQDPLKSIPTVVLNGAYDPKENDKLRSDLMQTVCSFLPGEKPSNCGDQPSSANSITFAVTILPVLGALVLSVV